MAQVSYTKIQLAIGTIWPRSPATLRTRWSSWLPLNGVMTCVPMAPAMQLELSAKYTVWSFCQAFHNVPRRLTRAGPVWPVHPKTVATRPLTEDLATQSSHVLDIQAITSSKRRKSCATHRPPVPELMIGRLRALLMTTLPA